MNQYRCETCKFFGKPPNLRGYYGYCDIIDTKENSRELTEEEIKIHSNMGCASHSDFQSERDKVLEDHIESYIERIRVSSKSLKHAPLRKIISVSLLITAEHYEELRQAGEP
jgi:hypothetical protein